jgi:hypothetical protein
MKTLDVEDGDSISLVNGGKSRTSKVRQTQTQTRGISRMLAFTGQEVETDRPSPPWGRILEATTAVFTDKNCLLGMIRVLILVPCGFLGQRFEFEEICVV